MLADLQVAAEDDSDVKAQEAAKKRLGVPPAFVFPRLRRKDGSERGEAG